MERLSEERRAEVVRALEQAGVKLPCPRCSNNEFNLVDGYFMQTLQDSIGRISIGGESIPFVILVCTRCGYIAQHSLGALGLMPKEKVKTEEGKK